MPSSPISRARQLVPGLAASLVLFLSFFSANLSSAVAADTCTPIDIEIYQDYAALANEDYKSGTYDPCPPEAMYWKHHPTVYGGYQGCVGEKYLFPCADSAQEVYYSDSSYLKSPSRWNSTSKKCDVTGYTQSNRTFWVLWGDPLDKYELVKRTGLNPTVVFPLLRGPYPTYTFGTSGDALDDTASFKAYAFDFLVYLGAFKESERNDWYVAPTEGAESGMTSIFAAKALEIARTTCNRNLYALSEVPSYGYAISDAASLANQFASSFYNSSECLCSRTNSCKSPTVTISYVGWLPYTPLPTRLGGDNVTYAANSASPSSPWFETMVMPENPTGAIKTPQNPNPSRRVCDGVYMWPMYFGMTGYKIPIDKRPDCSAWSFSITKGYSASIRAGFILYKKAPSSNVVAVGNIMDVTHSMTHGLYSEWSWFGQMQLFEMIMSKPLNDTTSWVGAYTQIMDEKWGYIIDGFKNCPVVELSNPKAGAYAYFVYKSPYLGIQKSFISSFFQDVLGVQTTTYNWGFRGADPSTYFGNGYSANDFTRLQLYRDAGVYKEIGRRAKIICANVNATISDKYISISTWKSTSRYLQENSADLEAMTVGSRRSLLRNKHRELSEAQAHQLALNIELRMKMDASAASCAPEYNTACLFKAIGTRFVDE